MRQTSGQLADGLHLLTMQQRLLQLLALNPIDLHLVGLLFQQPGGVLQRRHIAGENVKGPRQLPSSSRRCRAGTETFGSP